MARSISKLGISALYMRILIKNPQFYFGISIKIRSKDTTNIWSMQEFLLKIDVPAATFVVIFDFRVAKIKITLLFSLLWVTSI